MPRARARRSGSSCRCSSRSLPAWDSRCCSPPSPSGSFRERIEIGGRPHFRRFRVSLIGQATFGPRGQSMKGKDRREFLRSAGLAGVMSAMAPGAFAQSGAFTVEAADSKPVEKPKHSIRFAVIGMDHAHIFSMTAAVKRGGGELVSMYATDPKQLENFRKQFGDVKLASGEDEILNDKSIQLILSASIPDLRAPLAVRAMKAGKDVLVDKPGI